MTLNMIAFILHFREKEKKLICFAYNFIDFTYTMPFYDSKDNMIGITLNGEGN